MTTFPIITGESVKENSRAVADVMTCGVISAEPDTPVADIATVLERHRIKRVPIVPDGKIVGMASRANLIQALAAGRNNVLPPQHIDDAALREKIFARLKSEPWTRPSLVNVTVSDGTVDLWGLVLRSSSFLQNAPRNEKLGRADCFLPIQCVSEPTGRSHSR
jgi:predicted transcriptional regulator